MDRITIGLDSLLAVNTILDSGSWHGKHRALILETHNFLLRFHNVELKHIFHVANICADWLARNGISQPRGFHQFTFFPYDFLSLLYQDAIGSCNLDVNSIFLSSNNIIHPPFIPGASIAGLRSKGATTMRVQPSRFGGVVGWSFQKKNCISFSYVVYFVPSDDIRQPFIVQS